MSLFDSNVDLDIREDDEEEEKATSAEDEAQTTTTNKERTESTTANIDDVPTEESVKRSRDLPNEDAIDQAKEATRERPSFEGGKNILYQNSPEEPVDLKDSHPNLPRRGYLGPELRKGISEAVRDPDSPLNRDEVIDDAVRRLAADEQRLETVVEESEHARVLASARHSSSKLWAIPVREVVGVADSRMYTRERRAVRVAHEHAARVALEKVQRGQWVDFTHVDVEELETLLDARGWTVLLNH